MSKPAILLIALAALGTASTAIIRAHGDEQKTPHGGIVVAVGKNHRFELLAEGSQFSVYILDGKAAGMSIAGMTASAEILARGKPRSFVALAVSGDHFVGAWALDPDGPTWIIVTLKSGDKILIGRFLYPPHTHQIKTHKH